MPRFALNCERARKRKFEIYLENTRKYGSVSSFILFLYGLFVSFSDTTFFEAIPRESILIARKELKLRARFCTLWMKKKIRATWARFSNDSSWNYCCEMHTGFNPQLNCRQGTFLEIMSGLSSVLQTKYLTLQINYPLRRLQPFHRSYRESYHSQFIIWCFKP